MISLLLAKREDIVRTSNQIGLCRGEARQILFDLSTRSHSGELLVVRVRDMLPNFAGAPIATVTPTGFEGW